MLQADKKEIESLLEKISNNNLDASKTILQKRSNLKEEVFLETVRRIALYTNDALWMEHLEAMDYLRSSVNLRAYGQREPIVEYKKEGLRMFKEMEEVFKEQVLSLIENINIEVAERSSLQEEKEKNILITSHNENSINKNVKKSNIGRNDPCSCGSGKKYKKCCGL
jgi:preprotein translocase subunit SecA